MESLDARYFEADLCHAIECEKSEIDRQMAITERLTNELKANNKKSYLELENQTIVKAQEERQEQQLQEERERREAADAINRYEKKIQIKMCNRGLGKKFYFGKILFKPTLSPDICLNRSCL